MDKQRRVQLQIYGRVQGVFYRASTRKKAKQLGLKGWVRNRSDGSVEAVVEGPEDGVDQLIEWAHQGPKRARVDQVEVTERDVDREEFSEFRVRR